MTAAHPACRVDGVLLLDKPAGPSSNQALQRVKHLFRARKAGHAGTLDPMASGLLPVLFGDATKFASYSADATKEYEATVLLGVRTSTGDLTGEVVERRPVESCADEINSVLGRFRGCILQTPPMHSALKRGGRPLYEMARRGQTIHREPRAVRIHALVLRGTRPGEVDLRITCSKGTYIRVLAEDIGAALGCGGTLKVLRRTRVGDFDVDAATGVDALERMAPGERLRLLLPVDAALKHLPLVTLDDVQAARVGNGQPIEIRPSGRGSMRMYAQASGRFLGLGEAADGTLRPLRLVGQSEQDPVRRGGAQMT
jgi:tRNA pseudouridine55 synthase